MSSNDNNRTTTPTKEVTPPKLVGGEKKGEKGITRRLNIIGSQTLQMTKTNMDSTSAQRS